MFRVEKNYTLWPNFDLASVDPYLRETISTEKYFATSFYVCFASFAFVMFSCAFATGVSATLSTFAFLFALGFIVITRARIQLIFLEKVGLLLFFWMAISGIWSDAGLSDKIEALSEYRILFMLPVFSTALAVMEEKQMRTVFVCCGAGGLVALGASYLIEFGILTLKFDYLKSLANSIFHGFAMSLLLILILYLAINRRGILRVICFGVGSLVLYNVLNIETGRTGYFTVTAVVLVFALSMIPVKKLAWAVPLIGLILLLSIISLDGLVKELLAMWDNVITWVSNRNTNSSAGTRLEFYLNALIIAKDHWLLGLGVGDVAPHLIDRYERGAMKVLTDNVHNEFLNMLLIGGVFGCALFCLLISALIFNGYSLLQHDRAFGAAILALGAVILISSMFNSIIKDYGEKHALMIVLSLVIARIKFFQSRALM